MRLPLCVLCAECHIRAVSDATLVVLVLRTRVSSSMMSSLTDASVVHLHTALTRPTQRLCDFSLQTTTNIANNDQQAYSILRILLLMGARRNSCKRGKVYLLPCLSLHSPVSPFFSSPPLPYCPVHSDHFFSAMKRQGSVGTSRLQARSPVLWGLEQSSNRNRN